MAWYSARSMLAARHADDAGLRRELAGEVAMQHGGQELAAGEVARGAEDDKREGVDGNDATRHEVDAFCWPFLCAAPSRAGQARGLPPTSIGRDLAMSSTAGYDRQATRR